MSADQALPERLDVIAVAPHPDDLEITCGGTLAKLVKQGYKGLIMAEKCTIYCLQRAWKTILNLSKKYFEGVKILDIAKGTESLEAHGKKNSLIRLSHLSFIRRADEFTQLRGSTWVYLGSLETEYVKAKDRVMSHVENSESIVGVVVKPRFDKDDRFDQLVASIATECKGLVFNGDEWLDPNGKVVLSLGEDAPPAP
jgi:hypothetical protein